MRERMKTTSTPVSVRAGKLEFVKLNTASWEWRDTYHWLLTLSWPHFCGMLLVAYLVVNAAFAALYVAYPGCLAGTTGRSWPDCFFFSVETLATVGYGHMYPDSLYGHLVATAEIMVGMFGLAAVTGLIFVRFSRPTARFVFSDSLVIAPFNGQPAVMLRVGNLRHQSMVEAQFRLMLLRDEEVLEGGTMRRFYELPLMFNRLIAFPAAITLRHIIDEKSPLFGQTPAEFAASDTRFMASIVCVDTVIQASVQCQHHYDWNDVRFGHRFVEIYTDGPGGKLVVDYGRLHHTESVETVEQGTTGLRDSLAASKNRRELAGGPD